MLLTFQGLMMNEQRRKLLVLNSNGSWNIVYLNRISCLLPIALECMLRYTTWLPYSRGAVRYKQTFWLLRYMEKSRPTWNFFSHVKERQSLLCSSGLHSFSEASAESQTYKRSVCMHDKQSPLNLFPIYLHPLGVKQLGGDCKLNSDKLCTST